MFMCDLPDFFNRFDRTDFIVSKHNTDQYRIRADCSFHSFRTDNTILIHIQISHLISTLLQILSCMKDCMMLNLSRNNMLTF